MDNMKCMTGMAVTPVAAVKEFPNVRELIDIIEGQQSNVNCMLNDVLYSLSGMEPKEGDINGSDYSIPRLESIVKRNETILMKLRKLSDFI